MLTFEYIEKGIYRTLIFMYEICLDFASIEVYEPFPGTAMFEEGIRRGLARTDSVRERACVTLPKDYYRIINGIGISMIDYGGLGATESEMKV